MAEAKILRQKDGPVGRVIISNPDRRNAMSLDMWGELASAADSLDRDQDIRVVILSGAGDRAFVSGADISRFDAERADADAAAAYSDAVENATARLLSSTKPVIAMIRGYCFGAGVDIALSCDLRLCSDDAVFCLPAARLGIGYTFDGLRRLVNAVGFSAARDMMFTGNRISAHDALRTGLVDRVVPAPGLAGFVLDYARTVASNAPLSVAAAKGVIAEIEKDPADRDLAKCRQLVRRCNESWDYLEGRRAFLEKREPRFLGC